MKATYHFLHRICLLITVLLYCSSAAFSIVGFQRFKDPGTGLYGIAYNGETVLLPRYDDANTLGIAVNPCADEKFKIRTFCNQDGLFKFKENGRWGLASLYYDLIPATYDKLFYIPTAQLVMVKKDDKWGLTDPFGRFTLDLQPWTISSPIKLKQSNGAKLPVLFIAQDTLKNIFLIDQFGNKAIDGLKMSDFTPTGRTPLADKIDIATVNLRLQESKKTWEKTHRKLRVPVINLGFKIDENSCSTGDFRYDFFTPTFANKPDGSWYVICGDWYSDIPGDYDDILSASASYDSPYFLTEKNGKYGIRTPGKELISPKFNQIKSSGLSSIVPEFRVEKNGLWGLYDHEGNELIPPRYKSLRHLNYDDAKSTEAIHYIDLYEAFDGNTYSIISNTGETLLSGNDKPGKFSKGKVEKALKEFVAAKYGLENLKEQFAAKVAKAKANHLDHLSEMHIDGWQRLEYSGAAKDQIGYISERGIITTPLSANHYYLILDRNPYSLEGMFMEIADTPVDWYNLKYLSEDDYPGAKQSVATMKGKVKSFLKVRKAAEASDDEYKQTFINLINRYIKDQRKTISAYEEKIGDVERSIERKARIDAISGVIQGVLGNAMQMYEQITGSEASAGESDFSSATSGSKGASGNKYNISEKSSCDVAKRSYDNYESQLMKMKTFPDKYDENQKRQIQSKMKSLRQKWENKGYSMRKSEYEDW